MPPFAPSKHANFAVKRLISNVETLIKNEIKDDYENSAVEDLSETASKMEIDSDGADVESDDTVRFGRVPKNEKERIRQAMEKASCNNPQQEYNEDYLISTITKSHLQATSVSTESIRGIIQRAEEMNKIVDIDPLSNCPLNPYLGHEDFHQRFSPIVREVVGFAKNIPGFADIKQEDKITLLRACVFEVLLVRFAALVDSKNKRIITIGSYTIYTSIYGNIRSANDFVNSLFTFVERINTLNLSEEEMALFTAAIVINPKRQNLMERQKITCLHKKLVRCLQVVMQRERPGNPNLSEELIGTLNDLLILNNLHSKQTQYKQKSGKNGEPGDTSSMDVSSNGHHESPSGQYNQYPEYSGCPMRYSAPTTTDYDEKKMVVDEGCPTSPTSTCSPDEEMRSPGSADSGCSTDSGCSLESGCSSDTGYSLNSHHAAEHHSRSGAMLSDDHSEGMSSPDDETAERLHKCHIKRKPLLKDDSNLESDKRRQMSWHKPQKVSDKAADSPVLRRCLEAPSSLKMEGFIDYYQGHGLSHPHKKFRPALERLSHPHETLDSSNSSRPSTSPSPSYSSSPSPSSSISSSPSSVSSSPYSSSNPSSPANTSILAHRLSMSSKKNHKNSTLLQSLTQESKFGSGKALLSDTLHDAIMNGQTRILKQHIMAAPSPSRYDDLRHSSPNPSPSSHMASPSHSLTASPPPSSHGSPPHSYSSPSLPISHIRPAHSPPTSNTPTGLGASAMSACPMSRSYMCDDSQPLNLSTKTPSPPPAMEA